MKKLKNFWLTEAECAGLEKLALAGKKSQARVIGELILAASPVASQRIVARVDPPPKLLPTDPKKVAEIVGTAEPKRTTIDRDKIDAFQRRMAQGKRR